MMALVKSRPFFVHGHHLLKIGFQGDLAGLTCQGAGRLAHIAGPFVL